MCEEIQYEKIDLNYMEQGLEDLDVLQDEIQNWDNWESAIMERTAHAVVIEVVKSKLEILDHVEQYLSEHGLRYSRIDGVNHTIFILPIEQKLKGDKRYEE